MCASSLSLECQRPCSGITAFGSCGPTRTGAVRRFHFLLAAQPMGTAPPTTSTPHSPPPRHRAGTCWPILLCWPAETIAWGHCMLYGDCATAPCWHHPKPTSCPHHGSLAPSSTPSFKGLRPAERPPQVPPPPPPRRHGSGRAAPRPATTASTCAANVVARSSACVHTGPAGASSTSTSAGAPGSAHLLRTRTVSTNPYAAPGSEHFL